MTRFELIQETETRLQAADLFYGHGTDNPLDEAVYIIFTILELEFDCEPELLEQSVSAEEQDQIHSLVTERIGSRKPAAYLLNRAWFCGLPFYVNENVLVPRSPFAELIEDQFQPWLQADNIKSVLDIGTGSGCIGIAIAHYFPTAEVDLVDIDEQAIAVAKSNIAAHKLTDRVSAYQSDLFSAVSNKHYDLIVSNPPYVSDDEIRELPEEYHHEPLHGLRADNNGLALVIQILKQAAEHLSDEGLLVVEVGHSDTALIEAFPEMPFLWFEFEHGGQGVFMLTREQLMNCRV